MATQLPRKASRGADKMNLLSFIATGSITGFAALGITYAYIPHLPLNPTIVLAGFFSGLVGYLMRHKEVKA